MLIHATGKANAPFVSRGFCALLLSHSATWQATEMSVVFSGCCRKLVEPLSRSSLQLAVILLQAWPLQQLVFLGAPVFLQLCWVSSQCQYSLSVTLQFEVWVLEVQTVYNFLQALIH